MINVNVVVNDVVYKEEDLERIINQYNSTVDYLKDEFSTEEAFNDLDVYANSYVLKNVMGKIGIEKHIK